MYIKNDIYVIYIYNGYAISSMSPCWDPDQGAHLMADQPRPVRPRHLAAARALWPPRDATEICGGS